MLFYSKRNERLKNNMTTNTAIYTAIIASISAILLVILVWNITLIQTAKAYKEIYQMMLSGLYVYEERFGDQIYFKHYNDGNPLLRREIIFFSGGDIKLQENLYIHKSLLFIHIAGWYYWRKFQKLKDAIIENHEYHILRERRHREHEERFIQSLNRNSSVVLGHREPFKFLS